MNLKEVVRSEEITISIFILVFELCYFLLKVILYYVANKSIFRNFIKIQRLLSFAYRVFSVYKIPDHSTALTDAIIKKTAEVALTA